MTGYILGEFGHLIANEPGCSPIEQFQALHSKVNQCTAPTRALLLTTYVKVRRTAQHKLTGSGSTYSLRSKNTSSTYSNDTPMSSMPSCNNEHASTSPLPVALMATNYLLRSVTKCPYSPNVNPPSSAVCTKREEVPRINGLG